MAFGKCKLFQFPCLFQCSLLYSQSIKLFKPKECPNNVAGMHGCICSSLYKWHNDMGISAAELKYVPGERLG